MTALTSPPTQTGPPALADRLLDRLLDRFLRELRAGVSHWVPDLLAHAATELESPAQRGAVAGDCEQTAPLLALLRSGGAPLAQRLSLALMQTIHDDGSRFGAGTPAASEDFDNTPGTPTLIGEAQIDEDIEIGRLVQIIDSATEAELQHLAALCSGLRRLDFADPAAVPLHPLDCARAVHLAVASLAPDAATRGLLLRLLGQAAGAQMRAVYATQADLLQRWGVAAAPCCSKTGMPPSTRHSPFSPPAYRPPPISCWISG